MTFETIDVQVPVGPAGDEAALAREHDLVAMLRLLSNALIAVHPGPQSDVCRRVAERLATGKLSAVQIRGAKRQIVEALADITSKNGSSQVHETSDTKVDLATGLENAGAAESAFARRLDENGKGLVAILVLDQLRALNARFGRAVGDQVLALATVDLNRELSNIGQLYRWNGPSFVVVADVALQREALDDKLLAIAARRIEKTVAIENRSIHVKLSFSFHIQPLSTESTPAIVARNFDDYVASRLAG